MLNTLQIEFKGLQRDEVVEKDLRDHAEKLERFCDRAMNCRVVVERPHRHQRQGQLYLVKVELRLPGHELIASQSPQQAHEHEDLHVAIRDAFDAVRRQLEDVVRRDRHLVKQHEGPAYGRVTELFPLEDYGFLTTADGREIYFHRNSVADEDWMRLEIDSEVRFSEEQGDRGPQASAVHLVGHRHHDRGIIHPPGS